MKKHTVTDADVHAILDARPDPLVAAQEDWEAACNAWEAAHHQRYPRAPKRPAPRRPRAIHFDEKCAAAPVLFVDDAAPDNELMREVGRRLHAVQAMADELALGRSVRDVYQPIAQAFAEATYILVSDALGLLEDRIP